jgi:hypothetical protein
MKRFNLSRRRIVVAIITSLLLVAGFALLANAAHSEPVLARRSIHRFLHRCQRSLRRGDPQ